MVESVFSEKPTVNNQKFRSNSLNQRSLLLFHSAIRSEKTKKHYQNFLNEFRGYFIIKNYDKLLSIKPKKLQEMIEDFVIYQKNLNRSTSLLRGKVSALKLFFSMNDVILNWEKIRKMLGYLRKRISEMSDSDINYSKLANILTKNTKRSGITPILKRVFYYDAIPDLNDVEPMPDDPVPISAFDEMADLLKNSGTILKK